MKRALFTLVILVVCCFAGIAYADQNEFSDVPAGHWAYAAVSQLAQDGIISGYDDGTFRGDKTMTRYEFAQLVANAITKEDQANAEDKALIGKLSAEFADELNALDVRVTNLEKNQSPLKIDGFYQYRYEYTNNPRPIPQLSGLASPSSTSSYATDKSETRSILWLNISNQFDGDTCFHGILASDSLGGRTLDAGLVLREANVEKKIGDDTELGVGRFFPDLGFGTIGGTPYMEGGNLSFGQDVKVNIYSVKLGDVYGYPNRTYNLGDAKFNLGDDISMSLAYNADVHKEMYDSSAVGLLYKGIPSIVLDSEYASNSATVAEATNDGSAPKAYFVRLRYKGADPFTVGSTGLSVEYKMADPGFDLLAFADPFTWNAPLNWATPGYGGMAENIKGFEYGYDVTVANRAILSLRYDKLDRESLAPDPVNNQNQDFFTAQITYLF